MQWHRRWLQSGPARSASSESSRLGASGLEVSCVWVTSIRQDGGAPSTPPRRRWWSDTVLVAGSWAGGCLLVVSWWHLRLYRASPVEVSWLQWGAGFCYRSRLCGKNGVVQAKASTVGGNGRDTLEALLSSLGAPLRVTILVAQGSQGENLVLCRRETTTPLVSCPSWRRHI
jgi:hypothetical protein